MSVADEVREIRRIAITELAGPSACHPDPPGQLVVQATPGGLIAETPVPRLTWMSGYLLALMHRMPGTPGTVFRCASTPNCPIGDSLRIDALNGSIVYAVTAEVCAEHEVWEMRFPD